MVMTGPFILAIYVRTFDLDCRLGFYTSRQALQTLGTDYAPSRTKRCHPIVGIGAGAGSEGGRVDIVAAVSRALVAGDGRIAHLRIAADRRRPGL